MDYRMERVMEFAKLNLKTPSELPAFVGHLTSIGRGKVLQDDDRIHFIPPSIAFRFVSESAAIGMIELIEQAFEDLADGPEIESRSKKRA